MSILSEFKAFAIKGNVIDLAVGFVVGAAFGKIVTSFTTDILMPPIGLALGAVDFSNLFINLSSKHYATIADAKKAGAPTLNIGLFLNTIIDFVIIAFAVFLLVKWINHLTGADKPLPTNTKDCPYCATRDPARRHAMPSLHVGTEGGVARRNRRSQKKERARASHAPVSISSRR